MVSYIQKHKIGEGGFGEVFLCERASDGKRFAKKILHCHLSPEFAERFEREVRLLSSLDHPNIIRVEAKQLQTLPYYFIMPFYQNSLEDEFPSICHDEILISKVFRSILDGMEKAHSEGVIHRDLTPRNILLNGHSDVVITDFGLGRKITSESTRITQTGYQLGTPYYVAPEQLVDSKQADERSDIFALGRLLLSLYTGPLTSALELNDVPPGPRAIIERCCRSNPDLRYQSISELKQNWLGLYDEIIIEDELGELSSIASDLSLDPAPPPNDIIERLLDLLLKHSDNVDVIHDTVMTLPTDSFLEMYELNPDGTRQIVNIFSDFTAKQSWGFSYTDKIGLKCKNLFTWLEDFFIRADLLNCLFWVGIGHHRYYVMETFAELLQLPKQSGEYLPIIEKFNNISEVSRNQIVGYLSLEKLNPHIRPLFTFESKKSTDWEDEIPF